MSIILICINSDILICIFIQKLKQQKAKRRKTKQPMPGTFKVTCSNYFLLDFDHKIFRNTKLVLFT